MGIHYSSDTFLCRAIIDKEVNYFVEELRNYALARTIIDKRKHLINNNRDSDTKLLLVSLIEKP